MRRADRKANRKKSLWETFVEEGANYPYAGQPEPLLIADKLIPGFEIFAAEMNGVNQSVVKEEIVEELVLNEGPEEAIPTEEQKDADDQKKECDFADFIFNNILDVFYDDIDISVANLFDTDDLFFSTVNAMNSNFAYLCDVLPNGYSVCDDHFMHMFDINSVQTESFNLGIHDNPKNILIASNLTPEEREKMKETLVKRQKVFAWGYEDMPSIDREITEHRIPTYSHVAPVK